MNTSHRRWLLEQLPLWEGDGLVTADAARTLMERYAEDDSRPGLAQIVMGALGALLIGTGLIAVIGYNWDDFSRPSRLLFAFLPLLFAQMFGVRVLQRGDEGAAWVRETAALLVALATGACILLVSQIYNMGGEWPDFLFWWFLLSLPLAWVLRSHTVVIFYLIAIAIWSVSQAERGKSWYDSPLLYPWLLLGLLPYWPGWKGTARLSVVVRWVMTMSAIVGLASAAVFLTERAAVYSGHDADAYLFLWALTAAVIAMVPLNQAGINESTGRKPQVVLGSLWLLGYGVAATFQDVSGHFVDGAVRAITLPWCWGLLAVLVAFVSAACLRRRWAVLALASVVLLPLIALPFAHGGGGFYSLVVSALATLQLSIIGIALIVLELAGRRGAPRLGASLLSVLIIARMADSQLSLLSKGLAFIGVGVAFLLFNIYMSRVLRQKKVSQV